MGKVSSFKGLTNSNYDRKTYAIGSFKGVDFTNPILEVSPYRAINMVNLYRKENVIEKRNGFTHTDKFPNGKAVYNKWKLNYLNEEAKTTFVEVYNVGGTIYVYDSSDNLIQTYEDACEDKPVSAFYRNSKLWILGGKKFFTIDSAGVKVNVEDIAEVPTTTIGIAPTNIDTVSDSNRASYDGFNNLTYFHVNELSSGFNTITDKDLSALDPTQILKYTLDSNFKFQSTEDLKKVSLEIQYNPRPYDVNVSGESTLTLALHAADGRVYLSSPLGDGSTTRVFSLSDSDISASTLFGSGTLKFRLNINPTSAPLDLNNFCYGLSPLTDSEYNNEEIIDYAITSSSFSIDLISTTEQNALEVEIPFTYNKKPILIIQGDKTKFLITRRMFHLKYGNLVSPDYLLSYDYIYYGANLSSSNFSITASLTGNNNVEGTLKLVSTSKSLGGYLYNITFDVDLPSETSSLTYEKSTRATISSTKSLTLTGEVNYVSNPPVQGKTTQGFGYGEILLVMFYDPSGTILLKRKLDAEE